MNESDKEFLEQYDAGEYEKPSVTVDLLIYTVLDESLKVLMINRTEPPFKDLKVLPGTFVAIDESLEGAVKRVLKSKVDICEDIYFEQLFTWGAVDRDPRMRIISVSYIAMVPAKKLEKLLGNRSLEEMFYSVKDIVFGSEELAFDHKKIIAYGMERIKNKAEYAPVAFELLDETFTLPELQKTYEILMDKKLYKANFRRKIIDLVEETGELQSSGAHRPSMLYRRKNK